MVITARSAAVGGTRGIRPAAWRISRALPTLPVTAGRPSTRSAALAIDADHGFRHRAAASGVRWLTGQLP